MRFYMACYCFRCILLDAVPRWFRTRWPLKRFYWQKDELEKLIETANRIAFLLDWHDKNVQ